MLYPIKFKPCYKEIIWRGDNVFMPALPGKYTMKGHTKLLIT